MSLSEATQLRLPPPHPPYLAFNQPPILLLLLLLTSFIQCLKYVFLIFTLVMVQKGNYPQRKAKLLIPWKCQYGNANRGWGWGRGIDRRSLPPSRSLSLVRSLGGLSRFLSTRAWKLACACPPSRHKSRSSLHLVLFFSPGRAACVGCRRKWGCNKAENKTEAQLDKTVKQAHANACSAA